MRVKLSILVAPLAPRGPLNSLYPVLVYKRPQESQQKFIHFTEPDTTIAQLWVQIEAAYRSKYLTQADHGDFGIKKLQDDSNSDLDTSFTVGELFEGEQGEKIIKVIQTYVDRECSIPITSSLRPAGLSTFKRPLPPVPAFDSNKRRKVQHEENINSYSDVHPDRPLHSRERSVAEASPESASPTRSNDVTNPSITHAQDPIISDSEDERERERMRNPHDIRSTSRRSSFVRRSSTQQTSGRKQSTQIGFAAQNSAVSDNEPDGADADGDDEDGGEEEEEEGEKEDRRDYVEKEMQPDYSSSPEPESPRDRPSDDQVVFAKPTFPVSRGFTIVSEGVLSSSPKQSSSPELLRTIGPVERPSRNGVTPQAHMSGGTNSDIYNVPNHTDDERNSTNMKPRKLRSFISPKLSDVKSIARHAIQHKEVSTLHRLRSKTPRSASSSLRTDVSHADSPVHKVLDSQSVSGIRASNELVQSLHVAQTIGDKSSTSEQEVTSSPISTSQIERTSNIETLPQDYEAQYEHVVIGEDEIEDDVVSPQLLSASIGIEKQLFKSQSKDNKASRTRATRPQRTLRSHEQSSRSPATGKQDLVSMVNHTKSQTTSTDAKPSTINRRRTGKGKDEILSLSPGVNSSLPSLPVSQPHESIRGHRTTNSPQLQQYQDEEGNDHSSPMKRVKHLSQRAIARESADFERERLRSASERRQLEAKEIKAGDDARREYFRKEDERRKSLESRQIPQVQDSLAANEKTTTAHVPQNETKKAGRVPPSKAKAKISTAGPSHVQDNREIFVGTPMEQLQERNRIMKEKELEQKNLNNEGQPDTGNSIPTSSSQVLTSRKALNQSQVSASTVRQKVTRSRSAIKNNIIKNASHLPEVEDEIEVSDDVSRLPTSMNKHSQTSSSLSQERPNGRGRGVCAGARKPVVVVINSPLEARKTRQSNGVSTKSTQVNEFLDHALPDQISPVPQFTPINKLKPMNNHNAMRTDESVIHKEQATQRSQVSDLGSDGGRAETGPSTSPDALNQVLSAQPESPHKRTRQTDKMANLTDKQNKTIGESRKIQTRLQIARTTTSKRSMGKGKRASKLSPTIPIQLQDRQIDSTDDEVAKGRDAHALIEHQFLKTIPKQGLPSTRTKPQKAAQFHRKTTDEITHSSSSRSPISSRKSPATAGHEVQELSELSVDTNNVDHALVEDENVLVSEMDRTPAQYIPSSPSQSSANENMDFASPSSSSVGSSAGTPSPLRPSDTNPVDSDSSLQSRSEVDDRARSVRETPKVQSTMNTHLDMALQQDAERSAGPSSSLRQNQIESQSNLNSQRTITPPLTKRNASPDWVTPKHLELQKETTTYNSASTKDRSTKNNTSTQGVPAVKTLSVASIVSKPTSPQPSKTNGSKSPMSIDLSESSEEPSDVSSDSDNDNGSNSDEDGTEDKQTLSLNDSTNRKTILGSDVFSSHISSTKSPPSNTLPQLRPIPKPTTTATRQSKAAASSTSDSDSDSDFGDSDSVTSSANRLIVSKTASMPEGLVKENTIKKMKRIASFTRKVDKNKGRVSGSKG